jgi:putative peptidoglycan lipid II flippase
MSFRLASVLRLAGGLTLVVAAGRLLGFVREIVTAQQFGAGAELDAYLLGNTFPGILVTAVPEALGMAFVPAFVAATAGGASLWRCVRRFGFRLVVLAALVGIAVLLLAHPIVAALTQGDRPETVAHAASLLRILAVTIPLAAIVGVSAAACNASERFLVPAVHASVFNVCVLSFLVLRPSHTTSLAYGVITGLSAQAILQLWFARRSRRGSLPDSQAVRAAYHALVPVLFYSAMVQVNVAINRALASGLEVGAISQFNYASVLINLPASLFAASVATVLLARFSKLKAEGRSETAARGLTSSAVATIVIATPIAAGIALFSHPVVNLVFGHGRFTAAAAAGTGDALIWLSPTVISVSLLHLALRYINSQGRASELWVLGLVGVIVNLVIKVIFVRYWGLNGIAAGTSLATIIVAVWMLWVAEPSQVHKQIRRVGEMLPGGTRWL